MSALESHLFRHEHGRLVATLTRVFGAHNLTLVEDVVQDAFCRALETWKLRGVPDNPSAWLLACARNQALDWLRRERTASAFALDFARDELASGSEPAAPETLFEPRALVDDELRMVFSCCAPSLSEDAQIALILKCLCGFGVREIAAAFVTSTDAIEKRLARGKRSLAQAPRLFDVNDARALAARAPAVLRALYLLFSEGYHAAVGDEAVRRDLCFEAIRLLDLLLSRSASATPSALALGALMRLHAARLPARVSADGALADLADQDRSRWDMDLLRQGLELLRRAASGDAATEYHLQAAIAFMHATAPSLEATDWGAIVEIYDLLLAADPSPIVALNRAMALAQRDGPEAGIAAMQTVASDERLASYPFRAAALGELERRRGHCQEARAHFEEAARLARTEAERAAFLRKRDAV